MAISCVVEYVRERLEATQYKWMLFKEKSKWSRHRSLQRIAKSNRFVFLLLYFTSFCQLAILWHQKNWKDNCFDFSEGVAHFSGLVMYQTWYPICP